MAEENNIGLTIFQIANGSAKISDYLEGGKYYSQLLEYIDAMQIDYIILQDQSHRPVESQADFLSNVELFKALMDAKQPFAEVILYMTWARHADSTYYDSSTLTPSTMQDALYEAYTQAGADNGCDVALVGVAFGLLRDNSSVNLYNDDLTHPSVEGSYLAGLVMFGTIFDIDVTNATYIASGISDATATLLQSTAQTAIENK